MPRIFADRVMETATTTGTGSFTVAGAVQGFQTFSAVCGVGDTFDYSIYVIDGSGLPTGEWETGRGTYSGANTIARTEVHESSNAGALVNFSAGNKQVMLSFSAASAALYRFGSFFTTTPGANEVLMMHVATDGFYLPEDLAGSQFSIGDAPSADIELSLQVNGVEIGTITVPDTGGPVFDLAAATEIEVGDVVSLVAPSDSLGAANCAFTLRGGLA